MPKQFGFAALDVIFLVVEKARDYSWALSIFYCGNSLQPQKIR